MLQEYVAWRTLKFASTMVSLPWLLQSINPPVLRPGRFSGPQRVSPHCRLGQMIFHAGHDIEALLVAGRVEPDGHGAHKVKGRNRDERGRELGGPP